MTPTSKTPDLKFKERTLKRVISFMWLATGVGLVLTVQSNDLTLLLSNGGTFVVCMLAGWIVHAKNNLVLAVWLIILDLVFIEGIILIIPEGINSYLVFGLDILSIVFAIFLLPTFRAAWIVYVGCFVQIGIIPYLFMGKTLSELPLIGYFLLLGLVIGGLQFFKTESNERLIANNQLTIELTEKLTLIEKLNKDVNERLIANDQLTIELSEKLAVIEKLNKAAQEQLHLVVTIVGALSHDFNVPFQTVSSMLTTFLLRYGKTIESSLETSKKPGIYKVLNDTIVSTVAALDGLMNMTKALLIFARMEAGLEVSLEVEEVLVKAVYADSLEWTKGSDTTLIASSEVESIVVPKAMYLTIIMNLVQNAAKYTKSGGEVRINIAKNQQTQKLILSVSDTGIGIAEENLSKIFDKYFRVDSNSQKGLGIGLATVSHLVERMKGTVQVISKLGEGSTFIVSTPLISLDSVDED